MMDCEYECACSCEKSFIEFASVFTNIVVFMIMIPHIMDYFC